MGDSIFYCANCETNQFCHTERKCMRQAHGSPAPLCSVCATPLEDDGEFISCPECFEIMDDSPSKQNPSGQERDSAS